MGFESKIWADRISQYPNRRKLKNISDNSEIVVDITREEGEVTSEGSSFSANNMNDLEGRIADMFPVSVENGGTGANNAWQARTHLEVYTAKILYNNLEGTNSTIILYDTATNYAYLEIIYGTDGKIDSCLVFPNDLNSCILSLSNYSGSENRMYFKSSSITISGNTINFENVNCGWAHATNGGTLTVESANLINIYKVIGYGY